MNQEQTPFNLDAVNELNAIGDKVLAHATAHLFFIPFMTPEKFAEAIGLSKGVVGGWIDQGYIPTAKVGRYRMINMVVLVANLKEGKAS